MKRFIIFLFFAQMFAFSVVAQDYQSEEPQTEDIGETPTSALEKENGDNTVEEEKTKETDLKIENSGQGKKKKKHSSAVTENTKPKSSSTSLEQSDNNEEIDQSEANVTDNKNKKSSGSRKAIATFFKWCLAIFALWIVFKIIKYLYSRKCDNCGKWNSMKVVGKELVNEKSSSVTEKRKVRDSQGNTIRSYEVDVPATVYTYHIHRRCKHCGYQDFVTKQVKRKN